MENNQLSLFNTYDESKKEYIWKLSDLNKIEKKDIKVFSTFACGGGSSMGYKLNGCNVIGCCEIDSKINKIYNANFKPKYNFLMDLRDFNKLEDIPQELYNIDILDGSPPCSLFSMSGIREEGWGKEKRFREGQKLQTLDDLFFVFLDTVEKLKPKIVIAENVEGMMLGNAFEYVQKVNKRFLDLGYKVQFKLLDSSTMGIPQKRRRVFFIANRIGLEEIDLTFNYKPITYGEIKRGNGDKPNKNTETFRLLQYAKSNMKCFADIKESLGEKRSWFNIKIVWENDIFPTIRAGSPDYFRGEQKERVSKEDIITCSTFPQDYNFLSDNISNITYICGLSVPPLMMKRIVERLIKKIQEQNIDLTKF